FQAEGGIRDFHVTGLQTCALPIFSYRVWSPKSGYPGHGAYRDFHTFDHVTGLKPVRVTGRTVPSEEKAPYDPQRADRAVDAHVEIGRASCRGGGSASLTAALFGKK